MYKFPSGFQPGCGIYQDVAMTGTAVTTWLENVEKLIHAIHLERSWNILICTILHKILCLGKVFLVLFTFII